MPINRRRFVTQEAKIPIVIHPSCHVKALAFGFENLQKHKWDNDIAAAGPEKDRQHHEELNVPCY